MARKKTPRQEVLVVAQMSVTEVNRVQQLRRSGAAGRHGQGARRERSRSAGRAAAIQRAY